MKFSLNYMLSFCFQNKLKYFHGLLNVLWILSPVCTETNGWSGPDLGGWGHWCVVSLAAPCLLEQCPRPYKSKKQAGFDLGATAGWPAALDGQDTISWEHFPWATEHLRKDMVTQRDWKHYKELDLLPCHATNPVILLNEVFLTNGKCIKHIWST